MINICVDLFHPLSNAVVPEKDHVIIIRTTKINCYNVQYVSAQDSTRAAHHDRFILSQTIVFEDYRCSAI